MNTFFIPIGHTHHSNDCSNRGMEYYFAMNNCLLTPLIVPLYANCLIECLFFTYDCREMLLILLFSFGVIDCQLRAFKCPLGVLDCR